MWQLKIYDDGYMNCQMSRQSLIRRESGVVLNLLHGKDVSSFLHFFSYVELCGGWETVVWVALMIMSFGIDGRGSEEGYSTLSYPDYLFNH